MRKKKRLPADTEEPNLDISSLIDVCFLLLIYFIVTSIIAPSEKDLPMTMPIGVAQGHMENTPALIAIREDGAIVMNPGQGEEVLDTDPNDRRIPIVSERLAMMQAMAESSGTNLMVQIAAYEGVKQQRFIDLLNCLRGHNINHVTLTDFGED